MKYKNPIDSKILEISVKFDLAYESRDIEEIKRLIDFGKQVENGIDELSKIQLFYSIGTALGNIFELSGDFIFNWSDQTLIMVPNILFSKFIILEKPFQFQIRSK